MCRIITAGSIAGLRESCVFEVTEARHWAVIASSPALLDTSPVRGDLVKCCRREGICHRQELSAAYLL